MKSGLLDLQLYDTSAERAVLGTMLALPEQIPVARSILKAEDFYHEKHSQLFELLVELFEEKGVSWDDIQLRDKIKKKGLEEDLPFDWILDIYEEASPLSTFELACKIVKEKSVQRRTLDVIIKYALPSLKRGDLSLPDFISRLTNVLIETSVAESKNALNLINDLLGSMGERKEKKLFSTGYSFLEQIIDGIPQNGYVVIGARPGVGKTSFALNLALHLHKHGKVDPPSILFVSLEMSEEGLMKRVMSIISGVSHAKIKNETLSDEEKEKISSACLQQMDRLTNIHVLRKPALDVHELEGQIVRHKVEHGVEVVIVDYLQLLRYKGQMGFSYEVLSAISQYLYTIAQKHNVLIIGLVQLGRETERRGDKRPTIADLKGSGQFEQDADIIILLYREGLYKKNPTEEDLKKLEVIVAKNRHGRSGSAEIIFDLDTQRIEEEALSIELNAGRDGEDINEEDLDF